MIKFNIKLLCWVVALLQLISCQKGHLEEGMTGKGIRGEFNLGLNLQTKAPQPLDVNRYSAKVYMFSEEAPSTDNFLFFKEADVVGSTFNVDGLTAGVNYCFVFVALPKGQTPALPSYAITKPGYKEALLNYIQTNQTGSELFRAIVKFAPQQGASNLHNVVLTRQNGALQVRLSNLDGQLSSVRLEVDGMPNLHLHDGTGGKVISVGTPLRLFKSEAPQQVDDYRITINLLPVEDLTNKGKLILTYKSGSVKEYPLTSTQGGIPIYPNQITWLKLNSGGAGGNFDVNIGPNVNLDDEEWDGISGVNGEGYFDVTFFANRPDASLATRAAINGESDRVQTLIYIIYRKEASGLYEYVKSVTLFRPENYSVTEMHHWPLSAIKETLPIGDYRVVFLGNLDSNLFPGQGGTAILSDYRGTSYGQARINMPLMGPTAFTNTNMFYMASADFNQQNPNVDILLQRIVTRHEYQREFVDVNNALSKLVDNVAKVVREQKLTTTVVEGLLRNALLGPVGDALSFLLKPVTEQIVDRLVGFLLGHLVDALNKVLLQELLKAIESSLKTQGGGADLLGLSNLLNPWSIANYADISGKFVTSLDLDLKAQRIDQNSVIWEEIPMLKVAGDGLSKSRYLALTLLNGDNLVEKIDIKKEGLLGPLVEGVVDDAALYGRLITVENDLTYAASPNVKYHTNYALLNLTLNNYEDSPDQEPLHLSAKLDPALVTEELLKSLLGNIVGGLLGDVLSPLLRVVTGVLDATTFVLDIHLPDLGIHNIIIEGGWEPTANSLGSVN